MKELEYGTQYMLFTDKGEELACSTNATFTVTADTQDISNKDCGAFGASRASKINYSFSTEGLVFLNSEKDGYTYLFKKMIAREPVKIYWGKVAEWTEEGNVNMGGTAEAWKMDNDSDMIEGHVIITSLVQNAPNGEISTYTCELQGASPLIFHEGEGDEPDYN